LLSAMVALLAPFMATTAAHAGVGLSAIPDFPSTVTVGQTFPARINVVNTSTAPESAQPVTVSDIRLVPACSSNVTDCAGGVDPGVFALGATATGSQACAGTTFTVSQPSPGVFGFSGPFSLAATQTCAIDFAVTALKVPTTDASPPTPGVQTNPQVEATATSPVPGSSPVRTRGIDFVTVNRATPSVTTTASPASAQVGGTLRDVATVSGLVNPGPGGTVIFQLYSDPACTMQAFLSTNPLDPATGTATSGNFTPTAAGTYHWVATYSGDANNNRVASPCSDPAETVTVLQGGNYTALAPTRIEDTRLGTGGLSGPLGPGATAQVQVAGRGGVPEGATAVVMNVTVTQPSAPGFLTVYPSGSPLPSTSNLNFTPGQTVPNLVVVKLGPGGGVALFNSAGSTHVILDVAGYFSEAGGNAGRYQPVVPARIADTRIGSGGVRLGPGQSFDLQVAGQGGAPATGIQAAVLNVAVTNTTAVSFLTVYPTGEPRPVASNLNFGPGDTVANRTMTKLGAGGRVTVYNQAGSTDVIVDLGGTYTDASVAGVTGTYTPLTPSRIVDTRSGTGANLGPVPSGGTIDVQVTGRGGVPSTGVRAVILNVTATQPAAMGYLTLFPAGAPRPNASDLNFAAGETRPNLVVVQVGTLGRVSLYSSAQTQVVVDVAGWFT